MPASLVFGEYTRKLDERYRLAIPAELSEQLFDASPEAVLVKEQTGALSLWNAESWTNRHQTDLGLLEQKLSAGRLEHRRHELQTLGRLLSTRHRTVSLAGRSRLLIPEGFREFLGAEPGQETVIVGAAVCIEIWTTESWQTHLRETIPTYSKIFDDLTA